MEFKNVVRQCVVLFLLFEFYYGAYGGEVSAWAVSERVQCNYYQDEVVLCADVVLKENYIKISSNKIEYEGTCCRRKKRLWLIVLFVHVYFCQWKMHNMKNHGWLMKKIRKRWTECFRQSVDVGERFVVCGKMCEIGYFTLLHTCLL